MEASVSQAAFARLTNVSRQRVCQWVKEGKIHGPGIDGAGRIVPGVASQQLRRAIDVGQAIGNGIETRLPQADAPATRDLVESTGDLISDQIKIEKLKEIQNRNRRQEIEDRAARGDYTRSGEVRIGMRKVASRVLTIVEGSLADIASEVAAQFKIPQRDVLHILRLEMRKVRIKGEAEATRDAAALPAFGEDVIADEAA